MAGATSQLSNPRSIWDRRRDMFYIVFLSLSMIFPFALDFVPYYPSSVPSWTRALFNYHQANYRDPLYARDPPFFKLYVFIEAVYLIPMCIWAIRGLVKDDKMVPLHLLVFATHFASSTAVCLVEMMSTENWPQEYINKNAPGYVVFLIISMGLWVDMFSRVKTAMTEKAKLN